MLADWSCSSSCCKQEAQAQCSDWVRPSRPEAQRGLRDEKRGSASSQTCASPRARAFLGVGRRLVCLRLWFGWICSRILSTKRSAGLTDDNDRLSAFEKYPTVFSFNNKTHFLSWPTSPRKHEEACTMAWKDPHGGDASRTRERTAPPRACAAALGVFCCPLFDCLFRSFRAACLALAASTLSLKCASRGCCHSLQLLSAIRVREHARRCNTKMQTSRRTPTQKESGTNFAGAQNHGTGTNAPQNINKHAKKMSCEMCEGRWGGGDVNRHCSSKCCPRHPCALSSPRGGAQEAPPPLYAAGLAP